MPADDFWSLWKRYLGRHFVVRGLIDIPEIRPVGTYAPGGIHAVKRSILRVILSLSPLVCVLGMWVSFFWDLGPEYAWDTGLHVISFEHTLRILSGAGITGYAVNWLILKMLFFPQQRRPVWGQGLIPANKEKLLHQIAAGIHNNLLNERLIRRRLKDSGFIGRFNEFAFNGATSLLHDQDFRSDLKTWIRTYAEEYFGSEQVKASITEKIDHTLSEKMKGGVKSLVFNLYKKMRPEEYEQALVNLVDAVPRVVEDALCQVEKQLPEALVSLERLRPRSEAYLTLLVRSILNKIDLEAILRSQLAHFDERKVESFLRKDGSGRLSLIYNLGTIIGIGGGLFIIEPLGMALVAMMMITVLWVVDIILYRFQQ